jgi:aminopeptidase N
MRQALLLFVVLCLTAGPSTAQRLSGDVVPEHYTLWFAPDVKAATFEGRATIQARTATATKSITLHAAELRFGEVRITSRGKPQTAQVTLDERQGTATLTVPEDIAEGPVTIDITYAGVLNDKLRGFYRSVANGRTYAVSQMEATDARRAFPSFDEPRFKATFDISLTVDAGDTAISNGRQISDRPGPRPGTHTLTFARTPKMSTYLVAMLVGDFKCRSGGADGIDIRVCSTPDKLPQTAFALDAAQHQLKWFNDYFGIKYPFGKLDIIGIPDFAAGAMENAGAITFRERALLVDDATASVDQRRNVASIIAHEIAHQWFGNLVTMTWWDDIWLNEGFATWAANKPLAAWRPEWRMELTVARELQTALALDTLDTTRAIRTHVETPDEINEVFDPIAYDKTASVLAMIESYVGPDAFRRGVTSYLKRHSYGNAAGEDFWNEMRRVTGRPVDRILRSFVDQVGAPLLTVDNACRSQQPSVQVTHGRFTASTSARPASQTWTFPACVKQAAGPPRCELLTAAMQTLPLTACEPPFVNAGSRGYYVTEYRPQALAAFAKPSAGLTPVERMSLLGDEWRMVRSGRHDVGAYLDLAAAWAGDPTPSVVEDIASRLGTIGAIASDAERAHFDEWIRGRFSPVLDALGLPGSADDPDDRQAVRATLVGLLAGAVDTDVRDQAHALALRYLEERQSVPPNIVRQVLRAAAMNGDQQLYERYLARLRASTNQPEEYSRFLTALVSFRDPSLVSRTLDLALSPEMRSQDSPTLIGGLLGTPWGRDRAWQVVRDRWQDLTGKLGVFQGVPAVVGALGGFCSAEKATEIRAFFDSHPVPAAARALRQALERIDSCVTLDLRQSKALSAWLGKALGP